ncbi:hypothetical protein [Lactovum odontotermitis]
MSLEIGGIFFWQQRKWSDIVRRINTSSNSNQLPKLEFEDIISGFGELNKDISGKLDNRKGTLFQPQNILFGKLRPYLKKWLYADFHGIAIGDFWVFESRQTIPRFDYYLMQADAFQRVANDTSGTKMPRSDWKTVSETLFEIPFDKTEQIKVGHFFQLLDLHVTLLQQKLDKLTKLKKAYLQQMSV